MRTSPITPSVTPRPIAAETSANAKGKIFNKLTARDARTIDQSRRLDAN